ncbi:capsular polysaccharide biosynthesis protein [Luteolibacter sp. AS25]|uniref:capsular polysaccharide biosynthesis protein n=1 Tax=Luteolibacter sp. AS25 TaxID=3135776 RepID=UPI00398B0CE0
MPDRQTLRIRWPFRKLWKHPLLDGMAEKLELDSKQISVGWGYRPSGKSAKQQAERFGSEPLLLEDAFLRSMKPGSGKVYGLVADSRGIYYDASGNSDLIHALNSGEKSGWMRDAPDHDKVSINDLISRFCQSNASKYNWYPGDFLEVDRPQEMGIMVVDQTRGDTSIAYGGVEESDFDRMVRDALDEHPQKPVYLRSHPDHTYRGKHSCFSEWVFTEPRVKILPSNLSPAECFKFCDEVYAATSLMGMEALLHGRKVKTYGWNFYAGWGLTEDRCNKPGSERKNPVTIERLFQASYLQYSHFFDPDTGAPCGLDRILQHIELQREIAKENAGTCITVSWVPWKKTLAEGFFQSPGNTLIHADSPEELKQLAAATPNSKLILWGSKQEPPENTLPVVRIEDGFLRSTGLGATFHRPLSWVFDDSGIYFDPTKPSRLEGILQDGNFSESEMIHAEEISNFLRKNRISKYNLAKSKINWNRDDAGGKKVILVPGQVELDASIKTGSPEVKTNGELLGKVRAEEPDAYIIFKCHPDLVAGARHGQLLPDGAEKIADLVVSDGNIIDWLELCDEVYTMTSTVGFEAILRGIPVRTYGIPFYAGWGLTRDHLSCPRRSRTLAVEELVCGALIRYPRYLNPVSGEFTTALQIARLLSLGETVGERRAWHLRIVSILKASWVKLARR